MKFKHPPLANISISSGFGYRTHPITGDQKSWHNGVDLRAPLGTPVFAPEDGVVVFVRREDRDASGLYIGIDTETGMRLSFAHLSKPMVSVGDVVCAGELVAFSGNTGSSRGPHVHFRVSLHDGAKRVDVDPEDYL